MTDVKIACTTHPYGPAADLHQAARDIAAAGADGIVIVCTRTWWRQLDFEAAASLDDFARTLDSLGLAPAAVETSSMRTDDPTFNEEEIAHFGRFLAARQHLPAERAIVISGFKGGLPYVEPCPTAEHFADAEWQANLEVIQRLCDLASPAGVKVSMHNHRYTSLERLEDFQRILAGVDSPALEINVDIGHLQWRGEDWEACLRALGPRVGCMFDKDVTAPGGDIVNAGDGMTDFREVFAVLREIGFDGWHILSLEGQPAPGQSTADFVGAAVARFRGLAAEA